VAAAHIRPAGPTRDGDSPIQAFFFERPILLIPVLAAVQLVLVAVWSRRRTVRARKAVWIGFVLFPLLIVMQALVVTDRERLIAACHELAYAYRDGDLIAMRRLVSETFESDPRRGQEPWSKDDLLDWLEHELTVYRVEEPRLRQFQTEVNGDEAVVRFAASCRVVSPDQLINRVVSNWELEFGRRDGQWLLENVRPRPSPLFPFARLHDLPR